MKSKTWLVVLVAIGGLMLAVALVVMSGNSTTAMVVATPTNQEPIVYTSTLRLDGSIGHEMVTSTTPITIESASITQEMRDALGNVVTTQSQSVPDFAVAYTLEDIPVGSTAPLTFSVVLPPQGHFEEWVRGTFTGSNGQVYTFTVPASPSIKIDASGFSLVNILEGEWYDTCPPDLSTPTPYPTQAAYTPAPTYTPEPTPTCRPTTYPDSLPTLTPLPTSTLYPTPTPYPPQPS